MQKHFANILGISPSTLSKWLVGTHSPSEKEDKILKERLPDLHSMIHNKPKPGDSFHHWRVVKVRLHHILAECIVCGRRLAVSILELAVTNDCPFCQKTAEPLTWDSAPQDIKQRLRSKWQKMIRRCSPNASPIEKAAYYDSGVRVCDEWLGKDGMRRFIIWALENGYEPGLQIDKDFKGNGKLYSPETCCFVTRAVNNAQRRKAIQSNSTCEVVKYTGVSKTRDGAYFAQVVWKGKRVWGKYTRDLREAVEARNAYIIDNNLPHVINKL